ncbi:energy transducer TonB [Chitiniphilus purpureus]|uniref:Energy transducer TonB n=1 Tax=Chitiniphilus purpureus TaxID=2981137 RepID=A0ABY6DNQ2_9NEIS|nr:energy transducer TonB [Chitiniphilus sp. CD1]UXY15647.1 energy transducer TonB [Chitiniphilus sp. CD1]
MRAQAFLPSPQTRNLLLGIVWSINLHLLLVLFMVVPQAPKTGPLVQQVYLTTSAPPQPSANPQAERIATPGDKITPSRLPAWLHKPDWMAMPPVVASAVEDRYEPAQPLSRFDASLENTGHLTGVLIELELTIDDRGKVTNVTVLRSQLDEPSTSNFVEKAYMITFIPAKKNGGAVVSQRRVVVDLDKMAQTVAEGE